MEWLKLLSIFCSLSLRSPVDVRNPLDYETRCGLQTEKYFASALLEREEGGYYRGYDLQVWANSSVEGRYFCKEAQSIEFARISVKRPVSSLLTAFYGGFVDINSSSVDVQAGIKLAGLWAAIETAVGLNSYTFETRIGKKFDVNKITYVEPALTYKDISGSHYISFKTTVGLNF